MSSPDLSISIVSYNDRDFLNAFLQSIYDYTHGLTYEVLVVNNGSSDGTVEMVRQSFPKVDLIVNAENNFFTKATNQNLARARGEFVVYLSSDTLVTETTFLPMVDCMRRDPSIGVTGPVIYNFEGGVHSPGQRFPSLGNSILWRIGFHRRFPKNRIWRHQHYRKWDVRNTFDVDSVSGACLMTRRAVLDTIGLLDEGLVMFYDEHDFCKRVRHHGWRVVHCGKAEIKHYGHGTCGKEPSDLIMRLMTNSFYYLHRKYYGNAACVLLRSVDRCTEIVRRILQYSFRRHT